MNNNNASMKCGVMILAAGMGKRMRSTLPKVLHESCGKPLLFHVLNQVRKVNPNASVAIVVGHGRDQVEAYIKEESTFKEMDIHFVVQAEQKGTGHAARCAMDSEWGEAQIRSGSPVLILPGDLPLMTSELVRDMLSPLQESTVLRLLTTELSDPTGYGRILRKGEQGPVLKIVEEKDSTPEQKRIREVGASIYFVKSGFLKDSLQNLSNSNAQNEYYLTDIIELAAKSSKGIDVLLWNSAEDLRGVNDPWELSQASELMNLRLVRDWARQGVKFIDPRSTWLDITVELAEGVTVFPGAILQGRTRIGKGTVIGPNVVLKHMEVGDQVNLKAGTVAEQSKISSKAQIGPYAHLRPDSNVGSGVKVGNFVELKKTKVGDNTSIAHLSYLGDAEVGRDVNIGCGFITCNYDGRVIRGERKHRTLIEDEVFIGSDCQAVAPIRIGKGSFIASGTTVTEDVEPGDLAIARSRQVNKPGYAAKLKQNTKE